MYHIDEYSKTEHNIAEVGAKRVFDGTYFCCLLLHFL